MLRVYVRPTTGKRQPGRQRTQFLNQQGCINEDALPSADEIVGLDHPRQRSVKGSQPPALLQPTNDEYFRYTYVAYYPGDTTC